ncbi:retron system putative HNH endonuclease, partial [Hydrogenovibrio marinus]|uniref:TIGR02646 family protein n=1 Tax=Hydrogenovibrio marinus TaxID=28885 RepID=A0A066ZRY7_HYDMR
MRFIHKTGSGGYRLSQANMTPPVTAALAKSRWKSFGDKLRLNVRLTDEQEGLCAYSEIRPDLNSLDSHIEHVKPKSQFPTQTFDYNNLVMSALSSDDLHNSSFGQQDRFGGHAKSSKYSAALFISPLDVNCFKFFSYLSDGRVVASLSLDDGETSRANYTINLLNLNCPYLVNLRKNWIDELDQLIDEHIQKNWDLSSLENIYLLPVSNKLLQFFSASSQRFGK